ncbi:uncharacterized protein PGTG_13926 [Puccinia graminis f. sp. tritici CRL 75-36-700-3]|uniref:J domain-containing protein n=1 Tax=Puccinia graminis f. sp. tritici (strain CRL 75-36-700-3 / race SCCL) TaxID=418459 RepID=E3KTD0_PUCGT|nr:uncharacterized protein PGTG_13926 [Puccinia graminis f. sp. tritici CRL 75-36-700-3]EFP87555.2 hypothetical protein PGTG_13926 [Puccinia graminis f. sp. tritici CRL 75-36-700-3]
MEAEQPDQSFSDQEPIEIDTPPRVIPESEAHKRRRIHSPDPIANAAIIDHNLARVLWNAREMLEVQIQKRRRRSDQSLSESLPVASSSASHKPSKKARETSPKPECGTKRFQDADESPVASYSHPPEKKRAKQEILSPSTRPKITGSSSRPNHPKLNTGTGPSTGSSSSTQPLPNFILPTGIRTPYAIQVERADKLRQEGNVQYEKKNYPHALYLYTQAINSYPIALFPNQSRPAGYSTSLANRASAYMATGQYSFALNDLQESMEETDLTPLLTEESRSNFIKRVFRLVRCHLALLDGPGASTSLDKIRKPQSLNPIPQSDPKHEELQALSFRTKFLVEQQQRLNDLRLNDMWQPALQVMGCVEKEIMTWGFKFDLTSLPGSWTIWKAEMLARVGKPLEAQKTILFFNRAPTMRWECTFIYALVALGKADLKLAQTRLSDILLCQPNYEPASDMLEFLNQLMISMDRIERTASSGSHHLAVAQCEEFLVALKDPLLTTLRIKVETIKCEQLAEQCMRDPKAASQLCNQVISLNMTLFRQMNVNPNLPIRSDVYEPYQVYLIRALLAQARAMHQCERHDWKSSYFNVINCIRFWPGMALPFREKIFEEIRSRTGGNSYSKSYYRGHHSQNHSSRPTSNTSPPVKANPDPKGYYKALGLAKDASVTDIKKAFRTLSLTHHPDKGGETELFQIINEAHSVLADSHKRHYYDLTGHVPKQ